MKYIIGTTIIIFIFSLSRKINKYIILFLLESSTAHFEKWTFIKCPKMTFINLTFQTLFLKNGCEHNALKLKF